MFKAKINLAILSATVVLAVSISSCKKDKDSNPTAVDPVVVTPGAYDKGVFVTNEGNFGVSSGTLSFANTATNAVSNDVFAVVNSRPLGNVVQSMEIVNGRGYIVVNNSNKIEVVNAADMVSTATITGLSSPRYCIGIDNSKAYVSQWGSGGVEEGVKIINLTTNAVSGFIATGSGAEKMLKLGNFVYVTNSGAFGSDSTVTVINTTTDAVSQTIKVGLNPNSIQLDKNGKIWVMCGGLANFINPASSIPAQLVRINPATNTIEASIIFTDNSKRTQGLTMNKAKDKLFYLDNFYGGSLYSFDITASSVSGSALINRSFLGLGIDPSDDKIYASVGITPTLKLSSKAALAL